MRLVLGGTSVRQRVCGVLGSNSYKQISRRQEPGCACIVHCTWTIVQVSGQVVVLHMKICIGLGVRLVVILGNVEQPASSRKRVRRVTKASRQSLDLMESGAAL